MKITELPRDYSNKVVYAAPETFLGMREFEDKQYIVPDDEVKIITHYLTGKPSGEKFKCYFKNDAMRVEYPFADGHRALSHTYVVTNVKPCSGGTFDVAFEMISNTDDTICYAFDEVAIKTRMNNRGEAYPERVSPQEVEMVRSIFNAMRPGPSKGQKLHRLQKYYRKFSIQAEDGSLRIVTLKHSGIVIEDKIYILSGNGHHVFGSYGKVKIAYDVAEKKLVAVKFDRKAVLRNIDTTHQLGLERAVSKRIGFFQGSSEKGATNIPSFLKQYVSVMPFYRCDAFDFFSQTLFDLYQAHDKATRDQAILKIAVRITQQLLERLAQYLTVNKVVHRDIKPENILINYSVKQHNDDGDPISLDSVEILDAAFTDFGMVRELASKSMCYPTKRLVGTPYFMPPEMIHYVNGRPMPVKPAGHYYEFGEASEVYAVGKSIYKMLLTVFRNNPFPHTKHYGYLDFILKMMMFNDPAYRIKIIDAYFFFDQFNMLQMSDFSALKSVISEIFEYLNNDTLIMYSELFMIFLIHFYQEFLIEDKQALLRYVLELIVTNAHFGQRFVGVFDREISGGLLHYSSIRDALGNAGVFDIALTDVGAEDAVEQIAEMGLKDKEPVNSAAVSGGAAAAAVECGDQAGQSRVAQNDGLNEENFGGGLFCGMF